MIEKALFLAVENRYAPPPNPAVGCVITDSSGNVIGQGFTQRAGGDHAEIMALKDVLTRGKSAFGATAYVTLEPCSHHGRTSPCCDALISAGVAKVVASIRDPNPLVSGRGFAQLEAAGIEVLIGPEAEASRELNIGFFSRMIRHTPWVRLKTAASLDGKIALQNGYSQWITSEAARADGQKWRARACAILTGVGTVRSDNPRLDVRLGNTTRQPRLVVVDSRMETPLDANIFITERQILIYTALQDTDKKNALEARGATVIYAPSMPPGAHVKVDLLEMMKDLARREVNEVHVEAGPRLNASLIGGKLVDEFLIFLAPKLIGTGQGISDNEPIEDLKDALQLQFNSVALVGPDLRVLARPPGRDNF